jgi:hypothetical protein
MSVSPDNQPVTWDSFSADPLRELEQREIRENLCGFFELLDQW